MIPNQEEIDQIYDNLMSLPESDEELRRLAHKLKESSEIIRLVNSFSVEGEATPSTTRAEINRLCNELASFPESEETVYQLLDQLVEALKRHKLEDSLPDTSEKDLKKLAGLVNIRRTRQGYAQLKTALEEAANESRLQEFLLGSDKKAEKFLKELSPEASLMGVIMSEQGSNGALLNLVARSSSPQYESFDLITEKDIIDFVTQECVQPKSSVERLADFESRVAILSWAGPHVLAKVTAEAERIVEEFEQAISDEACEISKELQSKEMMPAPAAARAQYTQILRESLDVLKKALERKENSADGRPRYRGSRVFPQGT